MQLIVFLLSLFVFAKCWAAMPVNPAYVSPSGSGSTCTSETPCSLYYANTNAAAGDVVILKDGTYITPIYPSNSGTSGNMITYQAENKWLAILGNVDPIVAGRNYGMWIRKNYIKVYGIKVDATQFTLGGPNNLLLINQGSAYVEISNCWFYGPAYMQTYQSTHIWFHHNTVEGNTLITAGESSCDDATYGLQLGSTGVGYYGVAGNNTVENNIFKWGGHHNLETFTYYNIIRNNFFHNEGNMTDPGPCVPNPDSNSKYGNRNVQIYDHAGSDGEWNLIEGNRFGPSGAPCDDTGWGGESLTITSPKNIIRYNSIYGAMDGGVMFKDGFNAYSDYNRFYNNTIYHSGRYNPGNYTVWPGANFTWYGSYSRTGNVIKNNIFYSYGTGGADWYGGAANIYDTNTVINNFCTDAQAGRCSSNGNPLFVDGTIPAITNTPNQGQPDMRLTSGSPARDGGTYLTQANGSGSDSTTLIVDDAQYFQDGTWGSTLASHVGDWISIGSRDYARQISAINYATNTITLTAAATWADNANIWLYKKSDGIQVFYGSAPDYGAFEFNPSGISIGSGVSIGSGISIQ